MNRLKIFCSICALAFAAIPAAHAESPAAAMKQSFVSVQQPQAGYWTPERFKAAKPLPMPLLSADAVTRGNDDSPAPAGEAVGVDGVPPSLDVRPVDQRLFAPDSPASLATPGPQARGSFRAPYTSSRVFPLYTGAAAQYSADQVYPYRTVGRLYFSIGGSPYLCSASVIQLRVVATAGHCVHSGNGSASGFYSNFVFVPAYRNGAMPFLSWKGTMVAVTAPWYNGGGVVPNAADHAMIAVADQPFPPGGPTVKLGSVTGMLGWQLSALSGNHTSKLGYPCNLDSCQIMQIVTSGSFRNTAPNNTEYGSDAEGGSSGGPWVQNFETLAAGGGTGSNTGRNRLVGVTSYGYVPNDAKVQGASNLGDDWNLLLKTVCAVAGNCS